MKENLGVWLMSAGGVLLAFGGLRVYSIAFADAAARGDITSAEGGIWIAAVVVGVVLLAVGWWLRRREAAT